MSNLTQDPMFDFIDQVRAIAQTGMHYSKDPYDRERYDKLLSLVTEAYSEVTQLPPALLIERLKKDVGYATSKVGVQGALFNPQGKILLERRSDDHLWCLPSGWVDVGETPESTIEKEFSEEVGLHVTAKKFLGYFSRKAGDFGDIHGAVLLLFYCESNGGKLYLSHECIEAGYFYHNEIKDWHKDHEEQAIIAHKNWFKMKNKHNEILT